MRLLVIALLLGTAAQTGGCAAEEGGGREPASAAPPVAAPAVQRLEVRVLRTLAHDPEAFTQGLVWHAGRLFESTGEYGESTLRELDPASGEVLRSMTLPESLFGEGLALAGDELVQLTWREGVARRWRLPELEALSDWAYEGEGWGLCFDGERFWMSDGSPTLTMRWHEDFAAAGAVTVRLEGRPVPLLNELECAEGWIYANVLGRDEIFRIDPASGSVVARIAAGALWPASRPRGAEQSLNGIAYDPERHTFYLTGKDWPRMFEVVFAPAG